MSAVPSDGNSSNVRLVILFWLLIRWCNIKNSAKDTPSLIYVKFLRGLSISSNFGSI